MRKLLLVFTFYYCQAVSAQSPYLWVSLSMDSVKSSSTKFKIDMKICQPVNGSPVKDRFNSEPSTIDFKALKVKDISCGEYIPFDSAEKELYHFQFGNQVFAWEKILIWRIVNWSSASWQEPMYIVIPVKLKSFTTFIGIQSIEYQSGKLIWLDNTGLVDVQHSKQEISIKLNGKKGIDTDSWALKKLLD